MVNIQNGQYLEGQNATPLKFFIYINLADSVYIN